MSTTRLCIVRGNEVEDLEREDIQHISASFERTAFVTNKHELYIYDHDEDVPREPVFRNVVHVSMSESHVLFLDREHNLYAFGSNLFGQVGIPSSQSIKITKPVNLNKSHESISRIEFKSCCAGGHHSSAMDTNGDLYSWGCGELGELGTSLGKTHLHTHDRVVGLCRHTPTRISSRVQQISCGYAHNAIVTLDGELKSFGWGLYGQLGTNSTENEFSPQTIDIKVNQVSCGFWHTCALSQGRVFVFGSGRFGQLGLGFDKDKAFTPQHVNIPEIITNITCGSRHSVALSSTGNVYFWGLLSHSSRHDTNSKSLLIIPFCYRPTPPIQKQNQIHLVVLALFYTLYT